MYGNHPNHRPHRHINPFVRPILRPPFSHWRRFPLLNPYHRPILPYYIPPPYFPLPFGHFRDEPEAEGEHDLVGPNVSASDHAMCEGQEGPTSELDELQAGINKATAAIEAAKESVSSLGAVTSNPQEDEEPPEVSQGPEKEQFPRSPLDLDLPDLNTEPQVSSTVTIPTPQQGVAWSAPEEPSVWKGQVMMQDVAKFSVSAFQVSGTSDYLSVDLKSSLVLLGRIQPSVCCDYIKKIGKNPSKEIIVLKLSPSNDDEKDNYQSFFPLTSTHETGLELWVTATRM